GSRRWRSTTSCRPRSVSGRGSSLPSCRATPRQRAFATGAKSPAVRGRSIASSSCRGWRCGSWLRWVPCPAWGSRGGRGRLKTMATTVPVGDLLTRIRNGQSARLDSVTVPASRLRSNVLDVLQREGYIRGWFEEELRPGIKELRVELKYDNGRPVIK